MVSSLICLVTLYCAKPCEDYTASFRVGFRYVFKAETCCVCESENVLIGSLPNQEKGCFSRIRSDLSYGFFVQNEICVDSGPNHFIGWQILSWRDALKERVNHCTEINKVKSGIRNDQHTCGTHIQRRRSTTVSEWNSLIGCASNKKVLRKLKFPFIYRNISSDLCLPKLLCDFHRPVCGSVGLPRQQQGPKEQASTQKDQDCGVQRIVPHLSRGGFNRLCGGVHALLGDKVFYLPLAGFFFSALAGFGGFLAFDNFNGQRYRQRLGFILLFAGLGVGFLCLLLGLP